MSARAHNLSLATGGTSMSSSEELALLRALLRASDYGVLLSDSTGRDLICNPRFGEIFGFDVVEALNGGPEQVRVQMLPRIKNPDEFVQTLDKIYADPTMTSEDEIEILAPKYRLLRRYTAPVLDDDKAVIGRLWTFRDITRTRRLEMKVRLQADQLREQSRELANALKSAHGRLNKVESVLHQTQAQLLESEKLSAVGLLAVSVAHDIRNILTPLAIELSLADQDDRALRAESFDVMQKQLDRLSLLTHRLLGIARPHAMHLAAVDLPALVEHTADLLRPQATQENVSVVVELGRNIPVIVGDLGQLDQVLVNLALNGVQAMHAAGGTLTISLSRNKGGACLRVADTGPGIPATIRKRLFDPFFTTKENGAGLGLFSSRRIVQDHGGVMKVRSSAAGTQFSIWLPEEEKNHGG
jgi:signal transduction histidine kinase